MSYELLCELPKFNMNSEQARFLKIFENYALDIALFTMYNTGDKPYNELKPNEKLQILKFAFEQIGSQYLPIRFFYKLRQIFMLKILVNFNCNKV